MCQLALDMFGRTLSRRNIAYSFRYENHARLFYKKCTNCHADPYLPVEKDLLLHGLAWPIDKTPTVKPVAKGFQTICMRCAIMSTKLIGYWIPTGLASDHMSYFMNDGISVGADHITFTHHPDSSREFDATGTYVPHTAVS